MKQVVFVKYNRTRKIKYQISTSIYQEGNTAFVEKKALTKEAISHIQKLLKNQEALQNVYTKITVLRPEMKEHRVVYPYIEGQTMEASFLPCLNQKDELLQKIQEANEMLFSFTDEATMEFSYESEFQNMFGGITGLSGKAVKTANIDSLYDNFIEKDGVVYCLDCEWVVNAPVPVEFLKYRSLSYFYRKYAMYLKKTIGEEEFYDYFGISMEQRELYETLERAFQQYVHGENCKYLYTANYNKAVKTIDHLEEEAFDLQSFKQLERKDKDITRLNELCHIKDSTIEDKDRYIADLEAIIAEMRRNPFYMAGRAPKKAGKMMFSLFEKKNNKFDTIAFMFAEKPQVSIIIPVFNQISYTMVCLWSIKEYTNDVSYEVILADDCSTDQTRQIGRFVSGITVVRHPNNVGFLRNAKEAAKKARGEYLLFLNNDTTVEKDWLKPLIDLLEQNPSIGMTGSKLVYPNGILQEAGGVIWQNGDGWNYGRNDLPDMPEYQYVKDVDYISGASMMIRRKLWEEIGGFDEQFAPAYYEDTDLAFSVRKKGYRVVYQPLSVVIHYEGTSNGTDVTQGMKQYQLKNKEKFRQKWAEVLQSHGANPNDLFVSRDRSNQKKMILFLDRYVPQFDKDAGSKSTLSYIKAFLQMGYTVKFLPEDFLRREPYTTVLEQMGVEVLTGSRYILQADQWIRDFLKHFDVVFLNRPLTASKYIELLRESTSAAILYYGHDLHYTRLMREYALTKDRRTLLEAKKMKVIEYAVMEQADVAYYPSYLEVEEIHKVASHIKARAIPVYVYEKANPEKPLNMEERKDLLFVGGFSHAPNADAVLWFAKEIFPQIQNAIPGIRFQIIGSNPTEEILALHSRQILVRGFVREEELIQAYKNAKMVVAPLRFGAGMKGKVIEALYHQVPLVTTSIGAEGLQNAEQVLMVEDDAVDFANAVIDLYQKESLLTEQIEKMPAYIKEYFSLEAAMRIIRQDIRKEKG